MLNKEKTFKAILEKVPNGILVVDFKTKGINLVNKEMELIASNGKEKNNQLVIPFEERLSKFFMNKIVSNVEASKDD